MSHEPRGRNVTGLWSSQEYLSKINQKTKLDPRHCSFVSHGGSVSILYSVSFLKVTASSTLLTTTAAFTVVAVCCHFKTVVVVCLWMCEECQGGALSMWRQQQQHNTGVVWHTVDGPVFVSSSRERTVISILNQNNTIQIVSVLGWF